MGGDGAVHGTSGPDFGRTDKSLLGEPRPPRSPSPGYCIRIRPPRPRNEVSEPSRVDRPLTFEDPAGSLRFRAGDTLPPTVSTLVLSSASMSCAVMDMRRYGIDRNRPQLDSDTSAPGTIPGCGKSFKQDDIEQHTTWQLGSCAQQVSSNKHAMQA